MEYFSHVMRNEKNWFLKLVIWQKVNEKNKWKEREESDLKTLKTTLDRTSWFGAAMPKVRAVMMTSDLWEKEEEGEEENNDHLSIMHS